MYNKIRENVNVTSNLLKLQVSFYWYPLINNSLIEMFIKWTNVQIEPPYWILIGKIYG